MVIRSV